MKITSFWLSLLAISFVVSLALAMGGNPKLSERKWAPSVQGIKLGSQYQEVIDEFGKPQSRKDRENKFYLIYDGLIIEIDRANKKSLWVSSIEITNSKWKMSPDIKVGMLKKEVIVVLGEPLHQEEREDGKVWMWWWHGNPKFDSNFSVTFEKNKSVKIIISDDTSL